MTKASPWTFDNTYRQLPTQLYSEQEPVAVAQPELALYNEGLALDLGLESLSADAASTAAYFGGNALLAGSEPIAQAYAGHQFGHFTMLGDGRAVLLGELITSAGHRVDLQLKGAGVTAYSRRGDGRATYASMLREYLISEAMHYLQIPTSRSLAVVKTGEPVYREFKQAGAVLTRVAGSHIRVGTFEYLAKFCPPEQMPVFIDYVIDRHYPRLKGSAQPALDLLEAVMARQLDLIVNWMRVGFIHGVMNTDNMSIAGETIDYGPCAFMNAYNPATVFSSIDTQGRYAYANQPYIANWNLAVFATALLPQIDAKREAAVEKAKGILDGFEQRYANKYYQMLWKKLGITQPEEGDQALADDLLQLMEMHQADYTNLFVALQRNELKGETLFEQPAFTDWHQRWLERIGTGDAQTQALRIMSQHNPVVIPRNHLVEEVLQTAVNGDIAPLQDLLAVLQKPYDSETQMQRVPAGFDGAYQTFCGT